MKRTSLVAVILVLMLAITAWLRYKEGITQIRIRQAESQIGLFREAVYSYRKAMGLFPESLKVLVSPHDSASTLTENDLIDPWGHEYLYEPPVNLGSSTIYSKGPPGQDKPIVAFIEILKKR